MEERENDADHGVPDMTMMPEITEQAINDNLKKRYIHDLVYVSFYIYWHFGLRRNELILRLDEVDCPTIDVGRSYVCSNHHNLFSTMQDVLLLCSNALVLFAMLLQDSKYVNQLKNQMVLTYYQTSY